VDEIEDHDEEALRQELRAAREKVDLLYGDLREVESELDGLAGEQAQYRLLRDVCTGLEELDERGGGDLFWGAWAPPGEGPERLRPVYARLDVFEKRLAEIEDRRQAILDEVQVHEDGVDQIAGDVLEAERQEELRKLEWLIEREDAEFHFRASTMPWVRGGEDDRRFRKSLAATLLVSLLLGMLLPLVDIPVPERWEILEDQDRLTRLIREELPPPPVVLNEPEPVPVPEEEPEVTEETPVVAEQKTPEPSPGPEAKTKDPAPKGILAFREKFSNFAKKEATARLGANARIKGTGGESGPPERSLVTTKAAGSSGGINLASLSRDVGDGSGREMGGVAVTQATSSIGTGGGGSSDRPLSGGASLSRTDEEIQIVFDRHKAALYRLYNRELRKDPTLKGQIVLRMTIEPDGSVSLCELKSTNMKSKTLSSQVVERVKTFDFGAKEGISPVTIVYPIDFLPAA
jgi:hypothetical protein